MHELKSTWVKRPDDPQRLPDNDVLCVLSPYLRLEPVCDPCVAEALDALWQRTIQDDVEGEFIVVRGENLCFALAGIAKLPGFLEERAFSPGSPASSGRVCREMVAGTGTSALWSGNKAPSKVLLTKHETCPSDGVSDALS